MSEDNPPPPPDWWSSPASTGGSHPPPGLPSWPDEWELPDFARQRRPVRTALATVLAAILAVATAGTGIALVATHRDVAQSRVLPGLEPPSATSSAVPNMDGIAAEVDPAVVDITARSANATAEGTGMILTSGGLVLTNNHVVEGGSRITANVAGSEQSYDVTVIGVDAADDVAVIQMQGASGMPTVKLGDSAAVRVGDPVIAIGNALGLRGAPTVSGGRVTALNRSITAGDELGSSENLSGLIQIDAPIASGDSGGPLVNAAGQVIGMNTAAAQGGGFRRLTSTVGFAIPSNAALAVAKQIESGKSGGSIQVGPPGIMGVEVSDASGANGGSGNSGAGSFANSGAPPPVSSGALVEGVQTGSPAAQAGIVSGDVITSVDGTAITSATALTRAMTGRHPGDRVTIGWVGRDGSRHQASLTLIGGPVR